MKPRAPFYWLASIALTGQLHAASTSEPLVSTTSASRQFTAHAPDALLSSSLCAFGEKLKSEWLQRLNLADGWRDPVVFVVRQRTSASAPPIAVESFQIQHHLKYQINCTIPPPIDDVTLGACTLEMLCAEFANRDRDTAGLTVPIPIWLPEGLAQSILGRRDQALAVVRRSAAGERPQRAVEVMQFTTLPADDAGRVLFRANAWLLTESLLRLPDGPRKMQQFLRELGATRVFARAFDTVYGRDLPDEATLEKWWSLQQARQTEMTVAEDQSATQTAQRLDALLGAKFSQLWRSYQEPWLRSMLLEKLAELEALRLRAHPSYRPVIVHYIEAATQLLDLKLNRFRRAANAAERQRAAVEREMQQVRAVLDQAERTHGANDGTVFQDFFRTLDRLERFEQQRRNAVSDYLDQFVE